jgi:2-keto-4-pentenoate hydratase
MKKKEVIRSCACFFMAVVFSLMLGLSYVGAADFADILTEHFQKKTTVAEVDPQMTLEQAIKIQQKYVANLTKGQGGPVGYKAGLTNPNVQKVFGVTHPVRGTLLAKMMLKSGAEVPAAFGAVPMIEGDLCVRVGNNDINQAKTIEEALKGLDAVIPAIELPDMVFAKGVKFTGPAIVAINVGARYFIMGDPIPLSATMDWQDRLENFTMSLKDETGAVLADGKGSVILGHPLKVVLWIKDSLAAEGKALKKGDILSLGSVTKMIPPKAGSTVKGSYIGLNPEGPVEITVTFK